ncbi:MAG TPA: hypothetical protein VMG10_07815, partial [Gemmataceae bacterium]|nr:hypothetical protein [Gemmataceae bacterium]
MNRSRITWVRGFVLLAGVVFAMPARGEETVTRPRSGDIAELVRQLGADDFHVREEASRRLMKIGLPAREALLEGAKSRDLEIRRRCRDLMPAILEAHRQAKLAAFIADKDGKQKHDLPGWERYRKIAGNDDAARQLFVAVQNADTGFLAAADNEFAQAEIELARAALAKGQVKAQEIAIAARNRYAHIGERCAQLCQELVNRQRAQLFMNGKSAIQGISLTEIAPLLLVAADPKVTIPVQHRYLFGNLLYQTVVQNELRAGRPTPFKKILLAWMERQAEDEMTAQILFDTINNLQIKEGLPLALKAARGKKLRGGGIAHALVTIGRLGDKRHLAVLESFLDDKTQFCGFGIGRAGGNVQGNTEVRDVALAMLVRLTKQSFKDYGFAISGLGFDHLMNNANYLGF